MKIKMKGSRVVELSTKDGTVPSSVVADNGYYGIIWIWRKRRKAKVGICYREALREEGFLPHQYRAGEDEEFVWKVAKKAACDTSWGEILIAPGREERLKEVGRSFKLLPVIVEDETPILARR